MVICPIALLSANTGKAKEIGRIVIYNDATGDRLEGNYDVILEHAGRFRGKPGHWRKVKVRGFRREQSPYHLLQMALDAALGQRRKVDSSVPSGD